MLPLTILTDGMAEAVGFDYRRFRPNILISGISGLGEQGWVGKALRIGTTLIGVRKRRRRCVMTTFHPDTLEQDASVLRRIVEQFEGTVALDCWVLEPGGIAMGDRVEVEDLPAAVTLPLGNAR